MAELIVPRKSALSAEAHREPVIRAVPMPSDVNSNGDVFGGWVMSQMDIAGGILAGRVTDHRVATVAVTAMTFNNPIRVGDVVSIYGEVVKKGTTSITVALETIVTRRKDPATIRVTEGTFVYVAIGDDGRPTKL